jgi:hypothetical protein
MMLGDGSVRQTIQAAPGSLHDPAPEQAQKIFPRDSGRLHVAGPDNAMLTGDSDDPCFYPLLQSVIIFARLTALRKTDADEPWHQQRRGLYAFGQFPARRFGGDADAEGPRERVISRRGGELLRWNISGARRTVPGDRAQSGSAGRWLLLGPANRF